jgi:pSer/pThr/pTyr-binding forkhead associated (FHA) protein
VNNTLDDNDMCRPVIRLTTGEPGSQGSARIIHGPVTVLGSGGGCDMVLASSSIDEAHAVIVRLGGGAFVCDLGAPGGTMVNGAHVRWARLEDGDELSIGSFYFFVEIGRSSGALSAHTRPFSLRNDLTIGVIRSEDPVLLIGRDAACDVVLDGAHVAPRHAIVVWTGDGPLVRDLQGRSLVRVNGRAVRQRLVHSGDSIGVGPHEMRFEIEAKTPAASIIADPANAADYGRPRTFHEEYPERDDAADPRSGEDKIPYVAGPPDYEEMNEDDATRELVEDLERNESGDGQWMTDHDAEQIEALDDSEVLQLLDGARVDSHASSGEARKGDGAGMTHHGDTRTGAAPRSMTFSPDELVAARVVDERDAAPQAFSPDFRRRVIAAQNALDERARKLRDELDSERRRLKACQDQLKEQARRLLEATKANEDSPGDGVTAQRPVVISRQEKPVASQGGVETLDHSDREESIASLERLFAGAAELPASDRNVRHTLTTAEGVAEVGKQAKAEAMSLQSQVNELMEIVRDDQQGMNEAEQRLESLRFEIERLKSEVARAREKHKVQFSEHEVRYESLQRSHEGIKQEREALMLRLRRLDAKESALNTRMADAKRVRKDMERESNRLARLQEEHDDRLRELRINLEGERHRLRLRQTELQKRASELAKMARTRRHAIEEIVREQQSELQDTEADIKAKRSAIAEAGRAELEKTATELEQLLSVRLSDVESELLARQESLDSWIMAIWDNAKGSSGGPKRIESIARAPKASFGLGGASAPVAAEPQVRHLAQLETELENLHRAVLRMEDDSDHRGVTEGLASRRASLFSGARTSGDLTTRFAEKFSSFRIGSGHRIDGKPASSTRTDSPDIGLQKTGQR